MTEPPSTRLSRLADELRESGFPNGSDPSVFDLVVEEADQALRPQVHERRVPSCGSIINPTSEFPHWSELTGLTIVRTPVVGQLLGDARRFADGLSSWLLRRRGGDHEWLMFDRPAGSERDLVVLSTALGATVVQRHPSGTVRIVGPFGVLRTAGFEWHYEPPVVGLVDAIVDLDGAHRRAVGELLEFAVHDLGAAGIGAILIMRPQTIVRSAGEERLPTPPPLRISTPFHLAPLRHALSQIDGAAVLDHDGTLIQLGVRLVPSHDAEASVAPIGGTRHTSARRYSYDDPTAIVVAVSDDGPVTVFRQGEMIGHSLGGA